MSRRSLSEIFGEVERTGVAIDVDRVIADIRAARNAMG